MDGKSSIGLTKKYLVVVVAVEVVVVLVVVIIVIEFRTLPMTYSRK